MQLEEVIYILNQHSYWVGYSSYHAWRELEDYRGGLDAVCGEEYFTVYTKEGHVVGRLHDLTRGASFSSRHLDQLVGYFEIFEIPFRQEVIKHLRKLLD